jgi:hypothetical protein
MYESIANNRIDIYNMGVGVINFISSRIIPNYRL